jgi:hypothetical protein
MSVSITCLNVLPVRDGIVVPNNGLVITNSSPSSKSTTTLFILKAPPPVPSKADRPDNENVTLVVPVND